MSKSIEYTKISQHSGESDDPAMSVNVPSGLPTSQSSTQLIRSNLGDSQSVLDENVEGDNKSVSVGRRSRLSSESRSTYGSVTSKEWFTVAVLCFINLINYMDRFTIAGVLTDIQDSFKIKDDQGGLLQTVFIISYMIFAPIFGYLGDRFSRKWIMAFGITLWGATTLLGSFMNSFGWFLTFRALVGIGEASYSTIAPTLLSDLFVHDLRSKMLAVFYFAIPVGSGLGYIIGSETASYFGSWHWALRVTPILAAIAVALLMFIEEPERGASEGSSNMEATSYWEDVKDICRNKSFMLTTAGFTCVAFVAGALSWFGPKVMYLGLKLHPGNQDIKLSEVSFIFGAITMTAGIIGVPLGSYLSTNFIKRCPRVDPVICAVGLLVSAPLLAFSIFFITESPLAAYIAVFFGQVALNCNWAVVADMLLYVVIPTRRSTAEAFQILISHALGDAGSPYLVGLLSETLKPILRKGEASDNFGKALTSMSHTIANVTEQAITAVTEDSTSVQFKALQYSLFSTSFVEVLGGVFFLITVFYILHDRSNVDRAVAETNENNQNNSVNYEQQSSGQSTSTSSLSDTN